MASCINRFSTSSPVRGRHKRTSSTRHKKTWRTRRAVSKRLETKADELKKNVAKHVEHCKLAELDLEYLTKAKESAQACDFELENAKNQLEISKKSSSNLLKEVTKRKKAMIETVGLAQESLDLLKTAADLISKFERAAANENDFECYIGMIREYNSKVEKINRGTFHDDAASMGSLTSL